MQRVSLEQVPFLSALPRNDLEFLAATLHPRQFAPGETILREGDDAFWLGIVYSGRAKVVKMSSGGADTTLAVLAPGEIFGEVSVFSGKPYDATVLPMTHCSVLLVDRANVLDLVRRHNELAMRVIAGLSRRLTEAQETMQSFATERVEKRISQQLRRLRDQVGVRENGHVVINVPLTRRELADLAGTTVETAIRIMSQWTKEGLLNTVPGKEHPKGCRQCGIETHCPRCHKIVLLRPDNF